MVANYLEEHADIYMPFVISLIASDNLYNHDTSAPDAIDDYISSIPDHNTSSVLAYERYVERVRSDLWMEESCSNTALTICSMSLSMCSSCWTTFLYCSCYNPST